MVNIKGTPAHKSRNLARAVSVILTVQYQQNRQQTPSKVSAQLDVSHGATINYLMLVRSALRDLWHEGCG